MKRRKILAVAASSGKVGYVYLSDGDLLDWGLSVKASRSVDAAFAQMATWLSRYHPDMVLVEYLEDGARKGPHTRALIEAVLAAAREREIAWERVVRPRRLASKYADAAVLAEEFPQIAPWLPKPRSKWGHEPNNIVYFEALSLAVSWMDRSENGDQNGDGAPAS